MGWDGLIGLEQLDRVGLDSNVCVCVCVCCSIDMYVSVPMMSMSVPMYEWSFPFPISIDHSNLLSDLSRLKFGRWMNGWMDGSNTTAACSNSVV